jgi:hypothetical protein
MIPPNENDDDDECAHAKYLNSPALGESFPLTSLASVSSFSFFFAGLFGLLGELVFICFLPEARGLDVISGCLVVDFGVFFSFAASISLNSNDCPQHKNQV